MLLPTKWRNQYRSVHVGRREILDHGAAPMPRPQEAERARRPVPGSSRRRRPFPFSVPDQLAADRPASNSTSGRPPVRGHRLGPLGQDPEARRVGRNHGSRPDPAAQRQLAPSLSAVLAGPRSLTRWARQKRQRAPGQQLRCRVDPDVAEQGSRRHFIGVAVAEHSVPVRIRSRISASHREQDGMPAAPQL